MLVLNETWVCNRAIAPAQTSLAAELEGCASLVPLGSRDGA